MTPTSEHRALFHRWVPAHRGIIVKVARSFAFTAADVADLQQDLLLQLWLSLPGYAGQAHEGRIAAGVDLTELAVTTSSPAALSEEHQGSSSATRRERCRAGDPGGGL